MNATGGCGGGVAFVTNPVLEVHTNGGRLESGVVLALELGRGDAAALAVGLGPVPGTILLGCRFSGLPTNSTPITTRAIRVAATPAIQYGPLCSGPLASDDRTRSGRALLGDPVISSKTLPSSRRKFSLGI